MPESLLNQGTNAFRSSLWQTSFGPRPPGEKSHARKRANGTVCVIVGGRTVISKWVLIPGVQSINSALRNAASPRTEKRLRRDLDRMRDSIGISIAHRAGLRPRHFRLLFSHELGARRTSVPTLGVASVSS